MSNDILQRLTETLEARKQAAPESSYVAKLVQQGRRRHSEKSDRRSGRSVAGSQG